MRHSLFVCTGCMAIAALTISLSLQALQAPASSQAKSLAASDAAAEAQANLEKAVQNPVASLISVPFQNNTNLSLGSFNRTQDALNIQPVISADISQNWMVITRVVQPLILAALSESKHRGEYGLGDMVPTFFLSPRKPGTLIWGAGPAFTFPTATNTVLGQGKVSMGPSVVVLAQPGHWTLGTLVNNIWSIAGSGIRPAVAHHHRQLEGFQRQRVDRAVRLGSWQGDESGLSAF